MFAYELPSLEEASAQIMTFYENGFGFDAIEKMYRQLQAPIFLFGENPILSTIARGHFIQDNKPFVLRISVRGSRASALKDVEPGCHDEKINLTRLKKTGVIMTKDDDLDLTKEKFAETEVRRLCDHAAAGSKHLYKEPYFSAIKKYLQIHPELIVTITQKQLGVDVWKTNPK
jgi:hypothetical protein